MLSPKCPNCKGEATIIAPLKRGVKARCDAPEECNGLIFCVYDTAEVQVSPETLHIFLNASSPQTCR
jgi:hypothetical protein